MEVDMKKYLGQINRRNGWKTPSIETALSWVLILVIVAGLAMLAAVAADADAQGRELRLDYQISRADRAQLVAAWERVGK
jgi:hypothetical protein